MPALDYDFQMSSDRFQPTDTRALFRPLSSDLAALLRGLGAADWDRPTIAGAWLVRDIVAHLVDLMLRRVSFHRDAMAPPPPTRPIASDQDFVAFINDLNAQWVTAAKRLSPRVLTELFELASTDLADWFEALPLEAPALFGVSWAGEQQSAGWFDVGREFVEVWHHQQQIRLAVGAPPHTDPEYLRPVFAIALRALPHAFRQVGDPGDLVALEITGPAGGTWTLSREPDGWTLDAGDPPSAPAARVRLSDETAWKLLFHALPAASAAALVEVSGRAELAAPLLTARAVIV
jgi:uncharacterized protein (TIGR03083 family)